MATKVVQFSEAEIKKQQFNKNVNELRDPRYPFRLRFRADRLTASWFIVRCCEGNSNWYKVGNWPHLKVKEMIASLSQLQAKIASEANRSMLEPGFHSVKEVLEWYLSRSQSDTTVTSSRRATIKWAVTRQLSPLLGHIALKDIDHGKLDEMMFWPLQQQYELSTVRSLWGVLKQAFRRAQKLKHIEISPISSFEFSDFIEAKIKPKPSALNSNQLDEVYVSAISARVPAQAMLLIMLLHGTRIGETRLAKWSQLCFESKRWVIPECDTKTKQALTLPLTEQAIQIFEQYRAWQKKSGYEGVYLFPNVRHRNAITSNRANQLISEISQGDWTSHSIRKLTRSTWMDLGIDYMVGEFLLNHAMNRLDQTYIHTFAEQQKQQALEKYHSWLYQHHAPLFNLLKTTTILRSSQGQKSHEARYIKG